VCVIGTEFDDNAWNLKRDSVRGQCIRVCVIVSLCFGVTMSSIHVNANKTPIPCNPNVILNANDT
jgi:hypothetical protein